MDDILKKQLERAVREATKIIEDPDFHIGYDWEASLEQIRTAKARRRGELPGQPTAKILAFPKQKSHTDDDVFSSLLGKGLGSKQQVDIEINELRINVHKKVLRRNHEVSDSEATVKTRGKYQSIFRDDIVLPNYDYQCAISGIKTRSLLRAAHIVRWADNRKERLNPQNGICLSVLADACFEKGFITIDSNYKVKVSDKAEKDPALYKAIFKYDGSKINLPKLKENRPAKRFLLEHKNRVSL